MILEPGDNLVFYSIDRVGRHSFSVMKFLEDCINKDVKIHFTKENIIYDKNTSSHIKKIIYQSILDSEHYSDLTSEKVRKSIEKRRKEGYHFGKAPYGSKIVKNISGKTGLTSNKNEQKILKKVFSLFRNNYNNKYYCRKKKERKFPTKKLTYEKTSKQINEWITKNFNITQDEKVRRRNTFTPSKIKYFVDNQEKFEDML